MLKRLLGRQDTIAKLMNDAHRDAPLDVRSCRSFLSFRSAWRKCSSLEEKQRLASLMTPALLGSSWTKKLWAGYFHHKLLLEEAAVLQQRRSGGSGGGGPAVQPVTLMRGVFLRLIELHGQTEAEAALSEFEKARRALAKAVSAFHSQRRSVKVPEGELQGVPETLMQHFRSWKRDGSCDVLLSQTAVQGVLAHARSDQAKALVLREYVAGDCAAAVFAAVATLLDQRRSLARKLHFRSWLDLERSLLGNHGNFVHHFAAVVDRAANSATAATATAATATAATATAATAAGAGSAHQCGEDGRQVVLKVARLVGRCFGCEVAVAEASAAAVAGWSSDTVVLRVKKHGFVYFRLFAGRRGTTGPELAGATRVAPGHVAISMNFGKPWFGGPRVLEWQEIAAIAHEFGHAFQFLLLPEKAGALALSPLDVAEWPSVLMETLFYTDHVMALFKETCRSRVRPPEQYVRMAQTVAVYEKLLGAEAEADGDAAKRLAGLRRDDVLDESTARVVLEDVALWLSAGDVQSKAGYLLSYARAHSLLEKLGVEKILLGDCSALFQSYLGLCSAGVAYQALACKASDGQGGRDRQQTPIKHPFDQVELLKPDFAAIARYYGVSQGSVLATASYSAVSRRGGRK